MRIQHSASTVALAMAGALVSHVALAQVATNTATISNANLLNLLAPYLNLNATTVGQQTLATNLQQGIATNNGATPTFQAMAISDQNLFGGASNTVMYGTAKYGVAANLAGPLTGENLPPGGTIVGNQPVGGLGVQLGPIFVQGVANSGAMLPATSKLLTSAYTFTGGDLGAAKNYFANGALTNPRGDGTNPPAGYTPVAAVAPAGYTLPRADGLPNTTNSVYDLAYGVRNTQPGQDAYGSSRPLQVAPGKFKTYDPNALNGLGTNPSFPSGHTTYAYTDSILIGMLVPQEYQSMLVRASEYGNSRIILGVHYPLDIIGSRALASYDLAQAFTNPLYMNTTATAGATPGSGTPINLPALFNAAQAELPAYLASKCGASVATCANSAANTTGDPYVPSAANQATYQQRLTYGLPTLTFAQAPREAAPAGGPDASILLAPLFGGSTMAAKAIEPTGGIYANLSTTTINQILVNTETNALAAFYGSPLSYWTRIDLYSAAGYFNGVTGTLSLQPTDVVSTNVTIAAGGTLAANGSITGTTTVLAQGRLAGSGTVADVTLNARGAIAPGSLEAQNALRAGTPNVTGTKLTVNGKLAVLPGGTLAIFATPNQATSVAATGNATVTGGKLHVTTSPGHYGRNTTYTIVTATGGVTGRFASATDNLAFLKPMLTYAPTSIVLSFAPDSGALRAAAVTGNQRNVAAALANAARTNPNNPVVSALFNLQNAAQARAAFDSLSGEGITAAQNTAQRSAALFTSSIFDQTTFFGPGGSGNSITLVAPIRELADLPSPAVEPVVPVAPQRTWRAWGAGFGGVEDIHGNSALGTAYQQSTLYGGTIGVDYQVTPNYLFGVALGGTDGEFKVPGRTTSGSTTGGHIAIYDLATFGRFYGASTTSFSYFSNRTTRTTGGFGTLASETERGSFDSHEFRTRLEFGRHFDGLGFASSITPFVALEIADLRSNGFGETSVSGPGLLRLNVQGQSAASVPAFVGARFQHTTGFGGLALTPTLQVAWVHEFAPYRSQIAGIADLPGATFLVDGARPARDAAQVKVGGELALGPNSALFASFDGEFSGVSTLYAGKGGVRWAW